MKFAVFLLIVSLSCMNIVAFPGDTCTCLRYIPTNASLNRKVKYELKKSKAVFSGEVLRIDKRSYGSFEGYMEVTFKVKESWKLVKGKIVSIITAAPITPTNPPYATNCGYNFQIGESYLVYIESMSGNNMLTSRCSRTKKLADATEDLNILGKGKIPKDNE